MIMQRLNTGTTGKAFRLLLGAVLFAALAGLVLTDMGGFFRNGGSASAVARVGHKDINIVAFTHAYENALRQNNIQESTARQMGVPFMVLQQEITREVLRQAADKSGIRVSTKNVGGFMKRELESIPGNSSVKEKLDMVLQKQGVSESTLVGLLRDDIAIDLLTNAAITGKLAVPSDIVVAPWHAEREKRGAQIVSITPASLKDLKPLSDEKLKSFFEENKEKYRTSEKRDGSVLLIPQKNVVKDVAISDKEIQAYYAENGGQFMTSPRIRFEQIIVQDKALAQKIADEKPASFAKYKGKDADIIPADWYSKTTLPKEMQTALSANETKTGLLGPVQTSLGWHVLRVSDHEAAKPRAFADVKEVIARQLKDEKLDAELAAFSDQLDQMISEGQSLDAIAKEYGGKPLAVVNIEKTTALDKIKKLGLAEALTPRIAEALFTGAEDEVSPVIDTPNGDILLVQVTKLIPSVLPKFETIQNSVRQDAETDHKAKALAALAEKLIGAYPESFAKEVQKAGLSVENTAPATQKDVAGKLDAQTAQLLFTLSKKNPTSYTSDAAKATVIVLGDIVRDTSKPDEKSMTELSAKTRASITQELQQQFIRAWNDKLGVTVNEVAMQKYFGQQTKQD